MEVENAHRHGWHVGAKCHTKYILLKLPAEATALNSYTNQQTTLHAIMHRFAIGDLLIVRV